MPWRRLKDEARSHDRAFVITGRSLNEKTDLIRRVEALLGGRHAGTFAGIGQHTPGRDGREGRRAGRVAGADLLVSVGGRQRRRRHQGRGAAARLPGAGGGPHDPLGRGVGPQGRRDRREPGRKRGFVDPKTVPPVVMLDPAGDRLHAGDALALYRDQGPRSRGRGYLYGGDHPITDVTGLEGARRLMRVPAASKDDPEDVEVRLELQLAAWLAYFGPVNTPMGLSHELGRRIGASYEVPHGITSCVILAPSLQVLKRQITRMSAGAGSRKPSAETRRSGCRRSSRNWACPAACARWRCRRRTSRPSPGSTDEREREVLADPEGAY